jgi:hypothetical protein
MVIKFFEGQRVVAKRNYGVYACKDIEGIVLDNPYRWDRRIFVRFDTPVRGDRVRETYIFKSYLKPIKRNARAKAPKHICSYCFKEIPRLTSVKSGLCTPCKTYFNKKAVKK